MLETLRKLNNQVDCLAFLETIRWGKKRVCSYCKSERVRKIKPRQNRQYLWKCSPCDKTYTVTVGTVFHGARLPLGSWFNIIYFMFSSNNRVGCRKIADLTGVGSNTVWAIQTKIRTAMNSKKPGLLKKIIKQIDKDYNIKLPMELDLESVYLKVIFNIKNL